MKHRNRAGHVALLSLREIFLIICAFLMIAPLVYMILCSFKSNVDLMNAPFSLHISWENVAANYNSVMKGTITTVTGIEYQMYTPFLTQVRNVVIVTFCALVFLIVCAVPFGYALGRRQFRGKSAFMIFIIFVQTVPLFGYLIAFYYLMDMLGFSNNLFGLGMVYAGVSMPGTIIFMRGFFVGFPGEIEEAAEVDGAGEFKRFVLIVLPMTKGIIMANVLVSFMGYWNEFGLASILLTDVDLKTISLNIMMTAASSTGMTYIFPLLVLSAVPVFILFTIFQKQITTGGLSMGSIKG